MKKFCSLLLIASIFSVETLKAQPECSGVYLTAGDFMVGKWYHACAGRSISKESYFNLLANNYFFIISPDYAWRRIAKKDVFAIKSCGGDVTRIYQGMHYYLLNPGEEIPIYKTVANPVSKGNAIRIKYCFSIDPVSEIQYLTLENLKAAFPGNNAFEHAIDAHFKDDSDLYTYDETKKCFELNKVYSSCK